ncbi:hypothetical protein NPIL_318661 [Nephila pilipes]|uniref:Uncharacterized protein n=1 Tax=Nephila pilipes TaxID=299642 RepID=A0A8X6TJT0_NEPPI|nr:hypothetical protein NPIL_318661 [Nephila pilipes]
MIRKVGYRRDDDDDDVTRPSALPLPERTGCSSMPIEQRKRTVREKGSSSLIDWLRDNCRSAVSLSKGSFGDLFL